MSLSVFPGDLTLQSWIEPIVGTRDSSRKVSSSLQGGSFSVYRWEGQTFQRNNIVERVDITLNVEKTRSNISLSSKVSDVDFRLSYTNYTTLLSVLRENLTKRINKQTWDNLEKKWEKEESELSAELVETVRFSADVAYASSARYVRYGQSREKTSDSPTPTLHVRFSLGSLSVVLRRDDGDASDNYDMFLARGQGLEASLVSSSDCDMSLSLTLREISAFDLGERGRALHDKKIVPTRLRRASVMVEGYSPPERSELSDPLGSFDSHLVLKVDKESSADDMKVAMVVSYLSISALRSALLDIASFASCSWQPPTWHKPEATLMEKQNGNGNIPESNTDKGSSVKPSGPVHFRFVLHYPRFVFVVDEMDPHSRALAFRG